MSQSMSSASFSSSSSAIVTTIHATGSSSSQSNFPLLFQPQESMSSSRLASGAFDPHQSSSSVSFQGSDSGALPRSGASASLSLGVTDSTISSSSSQPRQPCVSEAEKISTEIASWELHGSKHVDFPMTKDITNIMGAYSGVYHMTHEEALNEILLARSENRPVNFAFCDLIRVDFGKLKEDLKVESLNLRNGNFERANLSGADLSRADLSGADLSRTNLSDAYLREANLRKANLREADLSMADLWHAKLIGANLSGADLSRTDLSGADLSGAYVSSHEQLEVAENVSKKQKATVKIKDKKFCAIS